MCEIPKDDILNRLGIRKEFDNWVKTIENRGKFKIGSRVELIEPFKELSKGSKGKVVNISKSKRYPQRLLLHVEFHDRNSIPIYDIRFKLIK